jgi:hypothetical protein
MRQHLAIPGSMCSLVERTLPIAVKNLLLLWICYLGQFGEVGGKRKWDLLVQEEILIWRKTLNILEKTIFEVRCI